MKPVDIIRLWAGEADGEGHKTLASDLGLPAKNVRRWIDFNSIPAEWFAAIVRAADKRGIAVDADILANAAEGRRFAKMDSGRDEAA